jgi:hypothetical protein
MSPKIETTVSRAEVENCVTLLLVLKFWPELTIFNIPLRVDYQSFEPFRS